MPESLNTARNEKSPDGSREKTIRKVTWIGLLLNLLIAGIKFATGIFGRSQALVADSVHSLTDSTTDLAVIAGSHFWSRPPDEDHPYGHQRLETLVTVFIGVMLAAAGIGVGWKAISTLHVAHSAPPKLIAALVALISIIGKEIMYRWTAYIGRRIRSPVLAANAWHHRTDAISSLPVLIAISGAMVFPSWSFLDRVGAVIVSIFIVHASIKILWPAFSELIDAGAPTEIRKRIRTRALKNEGVLQVHDIRTRYISSSIQVDLHIVVEGSITVREGHDIADDVKNRIINEIQEVLDVIVHVDPPEKAVREEDLK